MSTLCLEIVQCKEPRYQCNLQTMKKIRTYDTFMKRCIIFTESANQWLIEVMRVKIQQINVWIAPIQITVFEYRN